MAFAGQPDQSGITRLLSTINSLVCLRERRGREGGREGGAGWLSFNAQTVQSQAADDAVCPVRGSEESRESPRKRRQIQSNTSCPRAHRAPTRPSRRERGMEAQKVATQGGKESNLPAQRSRSACPYYFPLSVAFSAAAHSELLAAEREFRRRDLFTWSRSVLLIGGAARARRSPAPVR